jgi:hypothetical protein
LVGNPPNPPFSKGGFLGGFAATTPPFNKGGQGGGLLLIQFLHFCRNLFSGMHYHAVEHPAC